MTSSFLSPMMILVFFLLASTTNSFVPKIPAASSTQTNIKKSTTILYLEDWVADMIDQEIYRQAHKKEYENEWMEKNRNAVFAKLSEDFVMDRMDNKEFVMHRKDEKLAKDDPQKYCADRCISTGNCDIYEDL